MNLIFIWLITYAIPGIFAGGLVKLLPSRSVGLSKRNILIMHGALLVSTLASQYAVYTLEFSFPWFPDGISFFVYVASVLAAVFLLGSMGGWYGLSALLQQLTILSSALILLSAFSVYTVAVLIVPVFVFCHTLQGKYWRMRTLLFLLWGTSSIFLFSIIHNVWLIAALHTLFGVLLIKWSILYSEVA